MAPLSVKIVLDRGAVTCKVKLDTKHTVAKAHEIVRGKVHVPDGGKDYALFLRSADDGMSGVWLEHHRALDYYLLRDGDSLDYICRNRILRVKMLDGAVKALQVDEVQPVGQLMVTICSRLGITNYDEYGLCRDAASAPADTKATKEGTATLTLKRKAKPKERDAKLEELSKILKTDDHEEWLDQHRTLREQGVDSTETLLLKRRLFYSDRNVDARDPVQLNLLYVQTRNAILSGRHLVTEQQAAEFGGIQCQINLGDFQADKHKPGFIENLREYLPEQYSNSSGIEKKMYKAHKNHQGLSPLDAKVLYIKTARELPTYGVTFFLVKEKQKDKKKLVPRLLGINAEAILRLDENTKEVLQQWPLTHVKSYHVGKSETFTLNFGEYSDKEYAVKTQDALRIREILEGYIDLIRKRLMAKSSTIGDESMVICQENVDPSRANVIQAVVHHPSKVVTESFVGPNRIMPFAQGVDSHQGTQIVTMQQVIITNQGKNKQEVLQGEVPLRGDMTIDCIRKLNRMNSNSVKVVTVLTDPTEVHMKDVQRIVENMQADLPIVAEGLKATAEKQSSEDAKKMLLDELQDMHKYMDELVNSTKPGQVNTFVAKETAENIASLAGQIYFSMDPKTRRRSDLLRTSRKSFIACENTDAKVRRASFIVSSNNAVQAVDSATEMLSKEYRGPHLNDQQAQDLERSMQDKIGKLSAAIALYLTAHADSKNIDYPVAINSMNAINELMPELADDARVLANNKDPETRKNLQEDMRRLFSCTKKICSLTESGEHEQMQDASNNYADIAGKLIFTFGRGASANKENEIIDLAKNVGDKTSLLLGTVNELTNLAETEPAAQEVDDAGVRTAFAARDLLATAQLTAPAIHEPHCRSALTAAAEGLSSAVQHLTVTWKPLVEDSSRKHIQENLHSRTLEVAKALDALKESYDNINGAGADDVEMGDDRSPEGTQRLKFINSMSEANNKLQGVETLWDHKKSSSTEDDRVEVQRRLSQMLAALNAAVAALATATADRKHPDYATADLAVSAISELMPQIVADCETASSGKDEGTRAGMRQQVEALCDASRAICAGAADPQNLNDAASKFSAASGKLVFLISPAVDKGKKKQIIKLSTMTNAKTSEMLGHVRKLTEEMDLDVAAELDRRAFHTADSAQALLTAVQVTASSIAEPRCQQALIAAADQLRKSAGALSAACVPHLQQRKQLHQDLNGTHNELKVCLDGLVAACQEGDTDIGEPPAGRQDKRRLEFITSVSGVKNTLRSAGDQLKEPVVCALMREEDARALQGKLSQRLAHLNAAVAALASAVADRENPDYTAAEQAMSTIAELMPQVVQDSRTVSSFKDGKAQADMVRQTQELCAATEALCDGLNSPERLNEAAAQYVSANRKLKFLISPADDSQKENEISNLSALTCERASELLTHVHQVTEKIGGDHAMELDRKSARTADSTQALLTAAQVTAQSIADEHCRRALLTAVGQLSGSADELVAACSPHLKPGVLRDHLQDSHRQLRDSLDTLSNACKPCSADEAAKEKQRLKFVSSVSNTMNSLEAAQKKIEQPVVCALMREEDARALQGKLSQRLAHLNAAMAALAAAVADHENPNYTAAEQAMSNITELMPQVVQDSRTACSFKDGASQADMMQQLRELCAATSAMCDGLNRPERLNEAAAQYVSATRKLKFLISPADDSQKENEILNLSALTCGKASELLTHVHQLTEQIGGDHAVELDRKGARTADSTQALLTTAQVTSQSIADEHCRQALLAAVGQLSSSADDLVATCSPHLKPGVLHDNLRDSHRQLRDSLNTLSDACKPCSADEAAREKQRLKFVRSVSDTMNSLEAAQKKIEQPVVCALMREEDARALQGKLSQRLAHLNAAVATLASAVADHENPNYTAAEQAMGNIVELIPQVVQDSRTACSFKDGASQADMMQQLRELCAATSAMCDGLNRPERLNEAAAQYVSATRKLKFLISPADDSQKENEILNLSALTCGKASELLTHVHQLTEQIGGDHAVELDRKGARTADSTQALLTTAQVTSQSIADEHCRQALLAAVGQLSSSADDLVATCSPHLKPGVLHDNLRDSHRQLRDSLNTLSDACKPCSADEAAREKQRLKFVRSVSDTMNSLEAAQKKIEQPVVCALMREEDARALQGKLSQRLAHLNAAVATLASAVADHENPNYTAAEQAMGNIVELIPQVVQDSRTACSFKDGASQADMMQQLRELCAATSAMCDGLNRPERLNEAAAQYVSATRKLKFLISPADDSQKENEILNLSALTCGKASELLTHVHQLTEQIGGDHAVELDRKGARTADSTQALLTTAQVTSQSIADEHCRQALLAAVGQLSSSADDLVATCSPHLKPGVLHDNLRDSHRQLRDSLNTLSDACKPCSADEAAREKQRLKFVRSVSDTMNSLEAAQKKIEQPVVCALMREEDARALQGKLSQRLAHLNAAVATLASAVADHENPNYTAAEQAMGNIVELIPQVVQDSRTACSFKDGASQADMMQQLRELCAATSAMCDGLNRPERLNEAAAQYVSATRKLKFLISPADDSQKENEILNLSALTCGKASELLTHVHQLTEQIGGDHAVELDRKGARTADSTQALLTTAQVTSQSIADEHCRQALLAAVGQLSSSADDLVATCSPHLKPGVLHDNLRDSHRQLRDSLNTLSDACKPCSADEAAREKQRLKFVRSVSDTMNSLEAAQKKIEQPVVCALMREEDARALQGKLSQRLAHLNAAVATLASAVADHENPNYTAAEQAMGNIVELMPQVVQDSRTACSFKDGATQADMMQQLRELCAATSAMCDGLNRPEVNADERLQKLNDIAAQYATSSRKLQFLINPAAVSIKEKEIRDLSSRACGQASKLVSNAHRLTTEVGSDAAEELGRRGAHTAGATQAMVVATQVTAATIGEPSCEEALIFAAEKLGTSAGELTAACKKHLRPGHPLHDEVQHNHQKLDEHLRGLIDASRTKECSSAPPVSKKMKPPVPVRGVQKPRPVAPHNGTITQEFLDTLRSEESQDTHKPEVTAQVMKCRPATDDEKFAWQELETALRHADSQLTAVEDTIKNSSHVRKHTPMNDVTELGESISKAEEHIEDALAQASAEVAALVSANCADKMDYKAAQKPIETLPQLVHNIAKDGSVVVQSLEEEAGKAFMEDLSGLCTATRKLCDATRNDKEKLNGAALEFSNHSAKLTRVVGTGADPARERQLISRAKEIGDTASHLALETGGVASASISADVSSADKQHLCTAAARCVDAARKLVYTTRCVAPLMYHSTCQDILLSSVDVLSTNLQEFSEAWKSIADKCNTKKLTEETCKLQKLIDSLKRDVQAKKFGRKRDDQIKMDLNTPLRQMTMQILNNALSMSSATTNTDRARSKKYADFAKRLNDALRALDLANSRCQRAPHDPLRRNQLENAIQDLQVIVLQTNPQLDRPEKSYVVDLRDFLQNVASRADQLGGAMTGNSTIKKAEQRIRGLCDNIKKDAEKIMDPEDRLRDEDTSLGDVLEIDAFGEECNELMKEIEEAAKTIDDTSKAASIRKYLPPLKESCNLLRFATRTALATGEGAAYDAAFNDLEDIQTHVAKPLLDTLASGDLKKGGSSRCVSRPEVRGRGAAHAWALQRACYAAAAGDPQPLVCALPNYLTAEASRRVDVAPVCKDHEETEKLLDNINKFFGDVSNGVKNVMGAGSMRKANWNDDHPVELANCTRRLLHEVQESPVSAKRVKRDVQDADDAQSLNEDDIHKLLMPGRTRKVKGTKQELEDKLQKEATKVCSISGTVLLSVKKPESLARTLHATADAALQLADTARALKDKKKPVASKHIEEDANKMCYAVYNLMKTSDIVRHNPIHPDTKRRLLDACRSLNVAINSLVRGATDVGRGRSQQSLSELARGVQLRQAALLAPPGPARPTPYAHCVQSLYEQRDIIQKLNSDQKMSREELLQNLSHVTAAVSNSTEYAEQCAYLLSLSEKDDAVGREGLVDLPKLYNMIDTAHDSCIDVMQCRNEDDVKEKKIILESQVDELLKELDKATEKVKSAELKVMLKECRGLVDESAKELCKSIDLNSAKTVTMAQGMRLLGSLRDASEVLEHQELMPLPEHVSPDTQALCDQVLDNSRTLLTKTQDLIREVATAPDEPDVMTWVMFTKKKSVLDAFEAMLKSVKSSGERVKFLESTEAMNEQDQPSYVQVQVKLVKKWLLAPAAKKEVKATGQDAVRNIISIANKMTEDTNGTNKEEMNSLVMETEQLLKECTIKYHQEQYSVLLDRVREFQKMIERGVVNRVVEDFMEAEHPLQDLDIMADAERDETKRKFLLEKKIAELLAHLGRITRTARLLADTGSGGTQVSGQLKTCSEQTELLAPMLVKAAERRVNSPNDQAAIDNYKALLSKYCASLAKVRDLCDQSVDPMDFVQTAGETMQRMREESTGHNDPQRCALTSAAITKLANRVIHVGMSSSSARADPELTHALRDAQQQLRAATPAPDTRASKMPDWKDTTAKILRATVEVESALGGENIFKKQPEPNQPIYNEALNLHVAVRDWSSRDNEIVAVAKRMAVLMAKLSDYMNKDKQYELLATSKAIVSESREVARLAKKLAHECSDLRIKTDLLRTCEKIPTVSGQLKMLTSVKGASLGHHGTREDKEAMDMLVGNAQSLMLSIQDVIKGAASASVKIMSQRGLQMKWVRKNYY